MENVGNNDVRKKSDDVIQIILKNCLGVKRKNEVWEKIWQIRRDKNPDSEIRRRMCKVVDCVTVIHFANEMGKTEKIPFQIASLTKAVYDLMHYTSAQKSSSGETAKV